MADTIDTQSIIDRVKGKAAPTEPETDEDEAAEPDTGEADAHLGEAFDALTSGNRAGFTSAMKACLESSY